MNLGYDRENLIYIPLEGDLTGKYGLFKNQVQNMAGIQSVTRMTQNPTQIENGTGGVDWEGKNPTSGIEFTWSMVGYDFTRTLHTQMIRGQGFLKRFSDRFCWIYS